MSAPITAEWARSLFLDHCQPGDRGALERHGADAAVAAILAAVAEQQARVFDLTRDRERIAKLERDCRNYSRTMDIIAECESIAARGCEPAGPECSSLVAGLKRELVTWQSEARQEAIRAYRAEERFLRAEEQVAFYRGIIGEFINAPDRNQRA